ncbi:MAG: vWA domain-containing protein [Planctomycetota bacterium]
MHQKSIRSALSSLVLHLILIVILVLCRLAYPDPEPPVSLYCGEAEEPTNVFALQPAVEPSDIPIPEEHVSASSSKGVLRAIELSSPIGLGELRQGTLNGNGLGTSDGDGISELDHNFAKMVQGFREDGLDLIIVFDSTSSMDREIHSLKTHMLAIAKLLLDKLPKTRIGMVTYRDLADPIPSKSVRLTSNFQQLARFVESVEAVGGGRDIAEDIQIGLRDAVRSSYFRPKTHKVILLFGDASPHNMPVCCNLAREFAREHKGRLSTITCGQTRKLEPFRLIARAGKGDSIVLLDRNQIASELGLLVFGQENRDNARLFLNAR